MAHTRSKILLAALVLIGAMAYLTFAGMKSGWVYFVTVDQFTSDNTLANQRVRLHGKVAAEGFSASSGTLTAKFVLLGQTRKVDVVYRGAIPDMFKVGGDVVVEGRRDSANIFEADVLMTKCASKYEAGSPHAKEHKS
jgi:cytochrome c-type biogenesis protein CcmE